MAGPPRPNKNIIVKNILYDELDKLWMQDFEAGNRVLVKFTGETGKTKWPARLTSVKQSGFKVVFDTDKLPHRTKKGTSYFVTSHRAKNK